MERVWLNRAMHAGFFLLLAASVARLLIRHPLDARTVAALADAAALALVWAAGALLWERLGRTGRLWWLGVVVAGWLVLVWLAPSFAWCAVPLLFMCLRLLTVRTTVLVAAVLTVAVIAAQIALADRVDPSLVLAPIAVAAMTMVIFWELRRAGIMEERERLSREIHDTLAQGLTSQRMLLQAADRVWESDPDRARHYVRTAMAATGANLEEARRFVRDLGPADLDRRPLAEALRGMSPEFRQEGEAYPLEEKTQAVLLRVAQGALANAREHAGASRIIVTLAYLDGEVTLDVYDDGVGFDQAVSDPGRGYGLRAMRDRLAEVGGTLVVESAPGEGTAIAARIPT
ncbi:sensor histidine kinase [Nonomuraea sp. NN258]|uniref:sensor histidine kinase n=1 Tax=Nonomuraea antri TaxID=2730852 RepID=UPI00156A5525|nr:sensor histidine kinase [Nonomuraea antri]NRQ33165.1 sensor histidine kinase [Nonomuraea antri]